MAEINKLGNVISRCPDCEGGKSTFEYRTASAVYGVVPLRTEFKGGQWFDIQYRLFRCAGCGHGGLGAIRMVGLQTEYPRYIDTLLGFHPDVRERLKLPALVPEGITKEFREAEASSENECLRAAAGLFRSVLDKTFRANGYKTNKSESLQTQIDAAAVDGVITPARQRRAHEDIRVLGNDVLHDDWREVLRDEVELAHHYAQRILEDFYDDRETVLKQLREAKRVPEEDRAS